MNNTPHQVVYHISPCQNAALFPPKNETTSIVIRYRNQPSDYREYGYVAFARLADESFEVICQGLRHIAQYEVESAIARRAAFTVRKSLLLRSKVILPEHYVAHWDKAIQSPICVSELENLHGVELHAEITGCAEHIQTGLPDIAGPRYPSFNHFLKEKGLDDLAVDDAGMTTVRMKITTVTDLLDLGNAMELIPWRRNSTINSRWLLQSSQQLAHLLAPTQRELEHEH